jgi:hypothetical protein
VITDECPVCGEGTLTEHIEREKLQPRNFPKEIEVDMKHSVCDVCGSEIADRDQIQWNHEQVVKEKNKLG